MTVEEVEAAMAEWGFNCGPAALCAVLDKTPAEIRPHIGDFETRGYTNPTLMSAALKSLGMKYQQVYRGDNEKAVIGARANALVRIQWGGPWTKRGVPMIVRCRKTHWIAVRGTRYFDINAIGVGDGWMSSEEWSQKLVPWLCGEVVPEWNGTFWPTHVLEVSR